MVGFKRYSSESNSPNHYDYHLLVLYHLNHPDFGMVLICNTYSTIFIYVFLHRSCKVCCITHCNFDALWQYIFSVRYTSVASPSIKCVGQTTVQHKLLLLLSTLYRDQMIFRCRCRFPF